MVILRILERFFQFLSKTDQDVLNSKLITRTARMTQTSLGIMVLLTGVLAFFSGSYAIYTAFSDTAFGVFISVPLGVLYSCIIITFDREIVGTQNKRAVWIRLPLAVAIGMIVAVPLELRILDKSISKNLIVMSQRENSDYIKRRDAAMEGLDNREKEIEDRVTKYRDEASKWRAAMEAETVGRELPGRTGKAGRGPAYEEAKQNLELSMQMLGKTEAELQEHRQVKQLERLRIQAEFKETVIPQASDFLSRYQALEDLKSTSSAATAISWSLRLFFMLIEVFPALVKLFLPYSEYNAIVEARLRSDVQLVHAVGNQRLSDLASSAPSAMPKPLIEILNKQP